MFRNDTPRLAVARRRAIIGGTMRVLKTFSALTILALGPGIAAAGDAPGETPAEQPVRKVPAELARALHSAGVKAGQVGLLAERAGDGEVVAALAPDRPLIPASTMKLLTTACSLDRLGVAHTFDTRWLARARPEPSGVLSGDLWVVGGGNPLLRAEDLWVALRELHALGVRRIAGDVVVDDTLFEPPGYPEPWPDRRVPDPYDAPQGAMALAWNSVEVIVRAGDGLGEPAQIDTFPLLDVARVVNRVRTDRRTSIRVDLLRARGDEPLGILLRGTVRSDGPPYRSWVHLGHPTDVATEALAELMRGVGIAVEGGFRRGTAPDDAETLVRHRSPPLTQIVSAVNKYSSNFGAEMLLRSLAVASGHAPGSTAAGVLEVRECLGDWGVATGGLRLADGSGYSRRSRLTARSLVDTIKAGLASPTWGPEWLVSWPRAGEDGSLERRLERLSGRLRAKTGTLSGVSALAGTLRAPDGEPIVFALLINARADGAPVGPWLVDRLIESLASSLPPKPS